MIVIRIAPVRRVIQVDRTQAIGASSAAARGSATLLFPDVPTDREMSGPNEIRASAFGARRISIDRSQAWPSYLLLTTIKASVS